MTTATAFSNLQGMMTEAQKSFIQNVLLPKCPNHPIAGRFALLLSANAITKQQASDWITELKAVKPQPTAPITVDKLPGTPSAPSATVLPKPAYGIYAVVNGTATTYYNFVEKSVNGYKTSVLMRLYIKTKIEAGKTVQVGSWKKCGTTPTAKKLLAGLTAFTLPEAKEFGHKFSFCVKCGAYLSDPVSIANGIGPICIKSFM